MKILIATNNYDKVKEIKAILNNKNLEFYTLNDLNIISDPEENANSYKENALLKAKSAFKYAPKGYAVLSDDSGLSVDALDGAPGLYSARYSGINGTYDDNCEKLLHAMEGQKNRKAYFESDIILIFPDETIIHTVGVCNGVISYEKKGKDGFGYDPLFMPDSHNNKFTMAELGSQEKNKISHRSIALQKLKKKLEDCATIC